MNLAKERQLTQLMIKVCRGARVGADLELAEVAARRERQLVAELAQMDEKQPEPEPPTAAHQEPERKVA